ncbi:MFS-type efflux pump MSMEG_3705-like [Ciona intestinalis]
MSYICCGERMSTWYYALILMGCYGVGELGHFIIGIISKPISQELQFGEKGCVTNISIIEQNIAKQNKCSQQSFELCEEIYYENQTYCRWDYTGSGIEYQILAGPSFIAISTVMGIMIGVLGDKYNRVRLLTGCILVYSTMALLSGFSTTYWQLIIFRLGFAAGEAGCVPLSASIIADKFSKSSRALAMSVFNWGIYLGYGSAFAFGNYVTESNILGKGWRWSYYLTAIPGFVMMVIVFITIHEPKRKIIGKEKATRDKTGSSSQVSTENEDKNDKNVGALSKLWKTLKLFISQPTILMLLLAAAVRHTASYCWAYNAQLYFNHYFPNTNVGIWMTLSSIVGGSIGIASGGLISDLIVSRYGISTRLWILVISQVIAAPLAVMVLYLEPPYCFIALLSAFLFSEMWYGVAVTVVVELVPVKIRSTALGMYGFVLSNVGGNLPIAVTKLKQINSGGLRFALYIMYPGAYLISSFLFFATQLLVMRGNRIKNQGIEKGNSELEEVKTRKKC